MLYLFTDRIGENPSIYPAKGHLLQGLRRPNRAYPTTTEADRLEVQGLRVTSEYATTLNVKGHVGNPDVHSISSYS